MTMMRYDSPASLRLACRSFVNSSEFLQEVDTVIDLNTDDSLGQRQVLGNYRFVCYHTHLVRGHTHESIDSFFAIFDAMTANRGDQPPLD
jgi:hypothetical protein